MGQLRKIFTSFSTGQRLAIVFALIASVAGVTSFVRWHHDSDFRPLFTGMQPEDAAGIVAKLKESGVEHRLAENGTSVLVPSEKVDELRIELAGAGLPRSGRIGFELFDKTNLGVTDFAEHVNYRRALEGELERSIRVLNGVEQARVHLTFPKDSVFLDAREPAKASVLLSLRGSSTLSEQNVAAITNLMASAVEGLAPESVSVVDMRGRLLSRPKKDGSDPDGADASLTYKHALEKDLLTKVEATLTPLLGEDHFRVGISADCDLSTSEQTDETYDPTHSVMTSSQKAEDLSNRPDVSGVPGTGSNLPRPIARPAVTGGSSVSRRTENVAYETSRTVRQVKTPRGGLKRLSASVAIDQDYRWEGKGAQRKRVPVAPSAEKVKAIRELVAGAIGLTPARGDQLVIESLAFEQNHEEEPNGTPNGVKPAAGNSQNVRDLIRKPSVMIGSACGVLALVAAVAYALMRRKKSKKLELKTAAQLTAATANGADEKTAVLAHDSDKAQLSPMAIAEAAQQAQIADSSQQIENLRENVRTSVNRDPGVAANIIRTWMAADAGA